MVIPRRCQLCGKSTADQWFDYYDKVAFGEFHYCDRCWRGKSIKCCWRDRRSNKTGDWSWRKVKKVKELEW